MVDEDQGRPLVERVERLMKQVGYVAPKRVRPAKKEPSWTRKTPAEEMPPEETPAAAAGEPAETAVETKKKLWWKFW